MSDEQHDSTPREKVDEALDKAKQGARKLAGWLGGKLRQAEEKAREVPVLREQLDHVDQFFEKRAEDARLQSLEEVYHAEDRRVYGLQQGFEARMAELEQAKVALHENVAILRNRGVPESDSELRDYQAQIAALNARGDELFELCRGLKDERSRTQRRLAAARARLTAGASLDQLLVEARAEMETAQQRVEQVLASGGAIQ